MLFPCIKCFNGPLYKTSNKTQPITSDTSDPYTIFIYYIIIYIYKLHKISISIEVSKFHKIQINFNGPLK